MSLLISLLRLGACVGLFAACMWWLRRHGISRGKTRKVQITVLGTQSLGRHGQVNVVEIGTKILALGINSNSVSVLAELDEFDVTEQAPVTPAATSDDAGRFDLEALVARATNAFAARKSRNADASDEKGSGQQ